MSDRRATLCSTTGVDINDALLIVPSRKQPPKLKSCSAEAILGVAPVVPSGQALSNSSGPSRYPCSECGRHYATSSNLSRHKQTHRSPDSQLAKRCPTCGKVYI